MNDASEVREREPERRRRAVAIGVFDGLHRGHVAVVERLVAHASAGVLRSCVITFDPHPAQLLAPRQAPHLLATLAQRVEGLRSLGVDEVRVVHFDRARSQQSARDFVSELLVNELAAKVVVVGEDFHFGHDRAGSVALLEEMGQHNDFSVDAVALFGGATKWSSSAVRGALNAGDVDAANEVLGYVFCVRGDVVRGDARGRTLGYPTANVEIASHQQLPKVGIYAGATSIGGRTWPAAISVGTRPQFYNDGVVLVEVHVQGFDGDLYGASLDVMFLRRLRDEATFESLENLIAQIGADVAKSQEIFEASVFVDGDC